MVSVYMHTDKGKAFTHLSAAFQGTFACFKPPAA